MDCIYLQLDKHGALRAGDQLLKINGRNIVNCSNAVVYQYLSGLSGKIKMEVQYSPTQGIEFSGPHDKEPRYLLGI